MRVKTKTVLLARIRRHIRKAIDWYKIDNGMPKFWSSEKYKYVRLKHGIDGDYPYYVRSDRAITDIAKKILEEVRKSDKGNRTRKYR